MECQLVYPGADNWQIDAEYISALVVRRKPRANAYWQSVTSSAAIHFPYYVGLRQVDEGHDKEGGIDQMDAAMDSGLTFNSAGNSSVRLNQSQTDIVHRDITSIYSFDQGYQANTSCEVPEGGEGGEAGAGLWQWVVATDDGKTTVWTTHTVCRTGSLYNVEPACPYYACANSDCSDCINNWQTEI